MMTLTWIAVLAALTYFFGNWEERQINPNQNPESRINQGVREVVLQGNRRHHYVATGKINGQEVVYLLDTGATDVVVPAKLAERLKLKPGNRAYAMTANGRVEVRATMIDTLELGDIELRNIRASINPGMRGQEILLGMSALKQVEFTQRGNQLTLRQYEQ
jgi:aspartyl protease family protein